MNNFTSFFLVTLAISFAVQLWLTFRHMRHIKIHRQQVPQAFAGKITLQDHQKAADYTLTNSRFGIVERSVSTLLLLAWTLGGGLNVIDQAWHQFAFDKLTTGVAVVITVGNSAL